MWNDKLYTAGYQTAKHTLEEQGAAATTAAYHALDGARAVNEYEVGFRTFLTERGLA